jgi:hypothetical protein
MATGSTSRMQSTRSRTAPPRRRGR